MNVFIGGSISFDYLDLTITDELDKYMNGELEIFVGDAYGVDKLVQKYLDGSRYGCSTDNCAIIMLLSE